MGIASYGECMIDITFFFAWATPIRVRFTNFRSHQVPSNSLQSYPLWSIDFFHHSSFHPLFSLVLMKRFDLEWNFGAWPFHWNNSVFWQVQDYQPLFLTPRKNLLWVSQNIKKSYCNFLSRWEHTFISLANIIVSRCCVHLLTMYSGGSSRDLPSSNLYCSWWSSNNPLDTRSSYAMLSLDQLLIV